MTVETFTAPAALTPALGAADHSGLDNLRRWVAAASDASQLVTPLVNSAFIPDAYKPKVDPRATPEQRAEAFAVAVANATAAVLQGISLGVDPLVALQQIYIVHGRPGMYAKFAVALVLQRGHEVWTEESTDTRAVVCGRRRGSDTIERVVITMDQARKAGWTSNPAYGKTPADMLWSRAAARVCDRIASDVLKGLATVEDIETDNATPGAGSRTVQRKAETPRAVAPAAPVPAIPAQASAPRAQPAPATSAPSGPPLPGEEDQDDTPAADVIDPSQWDAINAQFRALGVSGPGQQDARLRVISAIVDRAVTQGRDLTATEARIVLDNVTQDVINEVLIGTVWERSPAQDEPAEVEQVQDEPAEAQASEGGWPE